MLPRFVKNYSPLAGDRYPRSRSRYTYLAAGFALYLTCLYLFGVIEPGSISHYLSPSPSPTPPLPTPTQLPPLYSEYHNEELRLPQHNWNRTQPSQNERFLFLAGHARGQGWGNALQEHLLNAYLAYRSGRSFVMSNFTWNDDGSLYSKYNDRDIPSQIPYSVLIRGPVVGGPMPNGDSAPLAVSKVYFDHVCPTKHMVDRNEVMGRLPPQDQKSAVALTDAFANLFHDIDSPCVELEKWSGSVYGHNEVFGVRGSLEKLWPDFAASPIITHFGYSTLIEVAFDMNRDLFLPKGSSAPLLSPQPYTTNIERYPIIPGLMAIHVRRGDYEVHCTALKRWAEDFVSVNTFSTLPDAFVVPAHGALPDDSDANAAHYRRRCFPDVREMAEKVRDVLRSPAARGVERLYIMTNARADFVDELKDALGRVHTWTSVASSRDAVLTWEQKYVAQAVDQLVAQRAQVLIGNGFSTLTSTAVTMRLANGLPVEGTRFW